tara:strand:- start:439 stop:930 length:492 start_codon:yes stop_codon:yes gene_type:complete
MATTITPSTLTVTHTESISLNGSQQGATNSFTVSSINEIFKRIVTCPANSETTVVVFHSSVADAALAPLDVQDVRYIRLSNKDASEACTVSLQIDVGEDDTAADASGSIRLQPNQSLILGNPEDGIGVNDANANLVTDLVDLESIVVFTGSNAVDVELFVASV